LAFRLAATAFAFAAAYHAAAMAVPAFARIAYPASYPLLRHVVFVLIDGSFAWLFLSRPIWLIWPYSILTIQVISGHDGATWRLWHQKGRIDGISVASVIGVVLGFSLLLVDWRARRRPCPSHRTSDTR
jgi:hypothetical protein